MITLCEILGCDFALAFGGQVTSCCLRCGQEPKTECDPLKFYSLPQSK